MNTVIHCVAMSRASALVPSLQGMLRSVRTQSKRGLRAPSSVFKKHNSYMNEQERMGMPALAKRHIVSQQLAVYSTTYIQMYLCLLIVAFNLTQKHHLVCRSASFDHLVDRNALNHSPFQASCSHLLLPCQDLLLWPHLIYVHSSLYS